MSGLDHGVEEEEEMKEGKQGTVNGMAHRLTIEDFVPERDESGASRFLPDSRDGTPSLRIRFRLLPSRLPSLPTLSHVLSSAVSEARRVDLENAHKEALIDRRKYIYSGVKQRELAVDPLSLPLISATRSQPSTSAVLDPGNAD